MSLVYLSEEFEIPLDELRAMLGVPTDTLGGTPLKEIRDLYLGQRGARGDRRRPRRESPRTRRA